MSRKYTRYGINRQYRRNPSRKRNPFPYRLPFVPDYRTNPYDDPDAGISNSDLRRYRKALNDVLMGAQKRRLANTPRMRNKVQKVRMSSQNMPKKPTGRWNHFKITNEMVGSLGMFVPLIIEG